MHKLSPSDSKTAGQSAGMQLSNTLSRAIFLPLLPWIVNKVLLGGLRLAGMAKVQSVSLSSKSHAINVCLHMQLVCKDV